MGREVRMVPQDWAHPKLGQTGDYKPLFGPGYKEDAAEFLKMVKEKCLQEAVDYMGCPDSADYMPDWGASERTHCMMYENTSEGTPISPAFESPEDLARWLASTGASSFARIGASYDQWLGVCKGGWAPSAAIIDGKMISGVEAMSQD